MTRTKSVLAAALIAALAATIAGCAAAEPADEDRTISIGYATAPTFGFAESRYGGHAIYDYLVLGNGDTEILPSVATEFGYRDDGTTLWFELRDDVVYSDGTRLDAELVKTILDTAIERDPVVGGYLHSVESVDVTGEYSLELHLSAFDDSVLYHLHEIPLPAPSSFEGDMGTDPIGSGPYVLDTENTTPDAEYVFVKREDAWNADAFPYDTVVLKILPDATARLNALKSGQVDLAAIDPNMVPEARASELEIYTTEVFWSGLLLGDVAGTVNPALADVRVRQAISMAFDRDAIAEALYGEVGRASNQPAQPVSPYFRADRVDEYSYDPDGARALLAEAGYPDGFVLKLATFSGSPTEPLTTQALADIGITVEYESYVDLAGFMAGAPQQSGAIFGNCYCVLVSAQLDPGGLFNLWHWSDPELADLLGVLTDGTATPEERAEAQAGIGDFLLDEAWIPTFGSVPTPFAHNESVRITIEPDRVFSPYLRYLEPVD